MWSLNMNKKPHLTVVLSLFLLIGAPAVSAPTTPRTLPELLAPAIRGGDYRPAPAEEVSRAEALFLRLAQGGEPAALAAEASQLALTLESIGALVIVREADHAKQGRGFFVFRRDLAPEARRDVLLVPHGFKDEMTRDIGLALFQQGGFSAAAWNSVPRRYERDGVSVDADLAHLPGTWFTAFALALARAWPLGQTLQIHGFDQGKRKSDAAANADMILSNGSQSAGAQLRRQGQCLASALARPVLLYSESMRELGGTTNVQGAALREAGYPGFVHMELSRPLRQALRDDVATRATLLRCLQP